MRIFHLKLATPTQMRDSGRMRWVPTFFWFILFLFFVFFFFFPLEDMTFRCFVSITALRVPHRMSFPREENWPDWGKKWPKVNGKWAKVGWWGGGGRRRVGPVVGACKVWTTDAKLDSWLDGGRERGRGGGGVDGSCRWGRGLKIAKSRSQVAMIKFITCELGKVNKRLPQVLGFVVDAVNLLHLGIEQFVGCVHR